MLLDIFGYAMGRLLRGFISDKTDYKIKRIYHIENDTIKHLLAEESLIAITHKDTPNDHTTFTDNGDLSLSTLYDDLCSAHSKEIRKEERDRLRILPDSTRRRRTR